MPEKMFPDIKSDFLEFCSNPGGKYQIVMTRSLSRKINFCDIISLKVEKPKT